MASSRDYYVLRIEYLTKTERVLSKNKHEVKNYLNDVKEQEMHDNSDLEGISYTMYKRLESGEHVLIEKHTGIGVLLRRMYKGIIQ